MHTLNFYLTISCTHEYPFLHRVYQIQLNYEFVKRDNNFDAVSRYLVIKIIAKSLRYNSIYDWQHISEQIARSFLVILTNGATIEGEIKQCRERYLGVK